MGWSGCKYTTFFGEERRLTVHHSVLKRAAFCYLALSIWLMSDVWAHRPARRWGGFGHLSAGVAAGQLVDVETALSAADSLGPGARPGDFGVHLGGGGRALLDGRWIVGARAYALLPSPARTPTGRGLAVAFGGSFDVGYAVVNRGEWLVYPYFGVGGLGQALEVTNKSSRTVSFGDRTIRPGDEEYFRTGMATVEVGLGVQHVLFSRGGGFIVGAEVGLTTSTWSARWRDDDGDRVAGVAASRFGAVMVRLTVGGGGFFGPRQHAH